MSDTTAPAVDGAVPARRVGRWVRRAGLRALAVVVALIAAAIVSVLRIDLGPALRSAAEKGATAYMNGRRMHIGHLSVLLGTGQFALDDVVIEGLTPDATPFLRAKRITVDVPWWSVLSSRRALIVNDVHMTGWTMTVERFANGTHTFPKFGKDNAASKPKRFTTTVLGVYAEQGEFDYIDHGSPWSVRAPNLSVRVVRSLGEYRGTAQFSQGTVQIQSFLPMWANMQTRFMLDGALCRLENIHLVTDGADSEVHGTADFAHWPEQQYDVSSRVNFPRMRDIFFANDHFSLVGEGTFNGVFHLFKGPTRGTDFNLSGKFASDLTGIDTSFGDYRLPRLTGSLTWVPTSFEVHQAESDFYGGHLSQKYSLSPLGAGHRATARWETTYDHVDLNRFGAELGWPVLRLAAIGSGENTLAWPNGDFHDRDGVGVIRAAPADGGPIMTRELPAAIVPVDPLTPAALGAPPGAFPAAGEIHYRLGPDGMTADEGSWAATRTTFVALHGQTAYGDAANMPFHVTSTDWQESDRLLAAIMSAFKTPTTAVDLGGYGVFDGTLTRSFKSPHIVGRVDGGAVRAWGVMWGRGEGSVVIDNGFIDVTNGLITGVGAARLRADGRFSLGYRKPGTEEMHATIRVQSWPAKDLRTAMDLLDWPIDGLGSADLTLYGPYRALEGFGHVHFDAATAWGESFTSGDGDVVLKGTGMNVDDAVLVKDGASIRGAAWLDWHDSTYSFTADGAQIPVQSFDRLAVPWAKLTGPLDLEASGVGSFDAPSYKIDVSAGSDLRAGDEHVGPLSGTLTVADNALEFDVKAATDRLSVSGNGRVPLAPGAAASMSFTITDSTIDPYLRLLTPKWPADAAARVTAYVQVTGVLDGIDHVKVEATIPDGQAQFSFPQQYALHNAGEAKIVFDHGQVSVVGKLQLVGDSSGADRTQIDLSGSASVDEKSIDLHAGGTVSLAILQLFSTDLVSSGSAAVQADLKGDLDAPAFTGDVTITDGRLRYGDLNSISAINGQLAFDRDGIRLETVHGQIGGGDVTFDGRVGLTGYLPDELDVLMHGTKITLQYPEGFTTIVDYADLNLRGTVTAPELVGKVFVQKATLTRSFENGAGLLGYVLSAESAGGAAPEAPAGTASSFPLKYDISITAPQGSITIANRTASITGHANLSFSGTYAKPVVNGRVDIERGTVFFEGNAYNITRGSIEFIDPNAIRPFFDIEAETHVRVPVPGQDAQIFTVRVGFTGTKDRWTPTFQSDPPLPNVDVLSLLFGDTPDVQRAELNAVGSPQEAQVSLARAGIARMATSVLSDQVGKVGEAVGVDSVALTPQFTSPTSTQLNPSARITLTKQLSSRAFVYYSRELSSEQGTPYEVIVLEFEQNDRVTWVVSRNEDQTFSLDFRVRYVF